MCLKLSGNQFIRQEIGGNEGEGVPQPDQLPVNSIKEKLQSETVLPYDSQVRPPAVS